MAAHLDYKKKHVVSSDSNLCSQKEIKTQIAAVFRCSLEWLKRCTTVKTGTQTERNRAGESVLRRCTHRPQSNIHGGITSYEAKSIERTELCMRHCITFWWNTNLAPWYGRFIYKFQVCFNFILVSVCDKKRSTFTSEM